MPLNNPNANRRSAENTKIEHTHMHMTTLARNDLPMTIPHKTADSHGTTKNCCWYEALP